MSGSATLGLPCRFIVGIHDEGCWKGFEKPCGRTRGTRKDPRSERYDDGLCPTHWREVFFADNGRTIATDVHNLAGFKREAEQLFGRVFV